jgi:hypothetical protein
MYTTAEYFRLQTLIAEGDPSDVWEELRAFVGGRPYDLGSLSLVEDFVSRHAEHFLEAIEREAAQSRTFAEAVAHVDISGSLMTPTVERFYELQRGVRERLGIDYWTGWLPPNGPATREPEDQ